MRRVWPIVIVAFLLAGCVHRVAPGRTETPLQFDANLMLNEHSIALHLATPASAGNRPLLVYATGDGGWRGKDLAVYRKLVSWGYPIVGFSSPTYLKHLGKSKTTRPALLARDYDTIIAFTKTRLSLAADTRIILVGVSRGAGLAVVAAGQSILRHELCGVVAVGLTKEEEHVRWFRRKRLNRVTSQPRTLTTVEMYEYLPRLGTLPLSVIQSTHDDYLPASDARTLFGPDTERRQLHAIEARNHSFTDAREQLYEAIEASLEWVDGLRTE